MKTSDFDYELPENLIAQFPTQKRSESKMLVLDKSKQSLEHKHFYDIIDYLTDNDILVLNNTKVIPARLFGTKETGAKIEVFLLKDLKNGRWEVLMKPAKRVHLNDKIKISDELSVIAKEQMEDGKRIVEIVCDGDIYDLLNKYGNIPLPPYIERKMTSDEIKKLDYNRYQTVYAKNEGSVAAPTAGLHFTEEILQKLKNKGVTVCYVTLNVGLGTFRPVKCDDVTEHKMDSEEFEISEETARVITEGKANGKNIVAVGTTSVRTLETAYAQFGEIKACKSSSRLFIYPPYEFKVIDKLITNFHLPKSTLIMLVSAFAGKDFVFRAYKTAVENNYRFYSYGDCMFIH
ncbi:MAG: tRNA preQ1(34) S-adenosylmethionine ribosyltransferase-isomerase QueA [Candidatus Melainabacteria bacterium]|nr:MAG: tRNA preQ1(34) S-adenosylmethionine ribosyltransferase-isomerase QueA [Candidatus Melainabacteria bacterium]